MVKLTTMPENNPEATQPVRIPEASKPAVQKADKEKFGQKGKEAPQDSEKEPQKSAKEINEEVKETVDTVKKELAKGTSVKQALDPQAEKAIAISKHISAAEAHPAHYLFEECPLSEKLVRENPEAAWLLLQMAQEAPKGCHDDPQWLMEKALELGKKITAETQRELYPHLNNILIRINEVWDQEPEKLRQLEESLEEIEEEIDVDLTKLKEEFNRKRLGDVILPWLGQQPPKGKVWQLFDESDSRFAKLPAKVKQAIRKANNIAKYDPDALTEHFLETVRGDIAESESVSPDLIQQLLKSLATIPVGQRAAREGTIIRWNGKAFGFRNLRTDEIREFIDETTGKALAGDKAKRAEDKWFNKFISSLEMNYRGEFRLSLPETQKLEEFYDWLEVRHEEEGERRKLAYEDEFDARQHLHYATKMIHAKAGDLKDIITGLQELTPTDFEYLATLSLSSDETFPIGSYAINLLESETKNILAEKMARWQPVNEKREKHGEGSLTREEMEIWNMGVMLEDSDLLPDLPRWQRIQKLKRAIEIKEDIAAGKTISAEDQEFYQKMLMTYGEDGLVLTEDEKALLITEGGGLLSKLEVRTLEKLKFILNAQGVKYEEFELVKAVVMARNWSIHSLHLPCIVAFWGRLRPGGMTYTMRAPPFEDLIRVINNEAMLFERFGFQGEMGRTIMSLYRKAFHEERARMLNITDTDEWKKAAGLTFKDRLKQKFLGDEEKNRAFDMLQVLEQQLGVPFTEMIRGGLFRIGGMLDMTGWRAKFAIGDELQTKYEAMGRDEGEVKAMFDNVGLGFKLGHADIPPEVKEKAQKMKGDIRAAEQLYWQAGMPERKKIWQKIRDRTPLLLAQLIPQKREEIMRNHPDLEWLILEKCLDAAQQEMVNRLEYHGKPDSVLFDEVLPKYLAEAGVKAGERAGYIQVVKELQGKFDDKALEKLALHDWPLTMTTADIPWHQADWLKIGKLGINRRIRDYLEAMKAREAWNHLMTYPSPMDLSDAFTNIKDFRESMVNYMGGEGNVFGARFAEQLTADYALKPFMQFNENVAKWIPGWTTVSEYLPERFLKWAREKIAPRLRTSWSRVFYGPQGYAFDEFEMNNVLHMARRMGVFTSHPEWTDRLRAEFKVGGFNRVNAFARWAIPYLVSLYLIGIFKAIYQPEEST